jgi:hypothetical protein
MAKYDRDQAYGKAQTGSMQKQPVFGNPDSAGNFIGDWAARVHRVAKNWCLNIVSIVAMHAENIQVEWLTM